MSDTSDPAGESGAPSRTAAPSPLMVNAQYVKDLSFEAPNLPGILQQLTSPPEVKVDVNIQVDKLQDETYEVVLKITSTAQAGEETVFVIEMAFGGVFTLNDVPDESRQPVLMIECPRLLFPFARNVVATVTREAGVPPLLINPIDFAQLYRRELERAQAGAEAAPPAGDA